MAAARDGGSASIYTYNHYDNRRRDGGFYGGGGVFYGDDGYSRLYGQRSPYDDANDPTVGLCAAKRLPSFAAHHLPARQQSPRHVKRRSPGTARLSFNRSNPLLVEDTAVMRLFTPVRTLVLAAAAALVAGGASAQDFAAPFFGGAYGRAPSAAYAGYGGPARPVAYDQGYLLRRIPISGWGLWRRRLSSRGLQRRGRLCRAVVRVPAYVVVERVYQPYVQTQYVPVTTYRAYNTVAYRPVTQYR